MPERNRRRLAWQDLMGIVLCMVTARSAAMAFNRVADWRLDARNPARNAAHSRRRSQPGERHRLCPRLVGSLCGRHAVFWPNWLPLSSLPVLAFLFGYSFTKRFTPLAIFGSARLLMLAPVSAWIAIRGRDPRDLAAVVLGGAVLLWVAGFDIIYACQDVDFDARAGFTACRPRSAWPAALRLATVCHLGMVLLLAAVAAGLPAAGWIYGRYLGRGRAAGL